jgi:hypothetical protein
MDHICLDDQILIEKIRGTRRIRHDATDGCRGKKDGVDIAGSQPGVNVFLIQQIEFRARYRDNFAVLAGKAPGDRRAGHSAMPRDPDALSG